MDLITHLRTFAVAANFGGFSEAARALGIAPSVAAKRISQLEDELGTKLFERTTRKVALTEAGEKLYARVPRLLTEFDDLLGGVERDEGKLEGHLRVMAPATLSRNYLAQAFSAFLLKHPRITLEVSTVDSSADPAERGFDISISGRGTTFEGAIDLPLAPVQLLLCASPGYLKKNKTPEHPRDLIDHACLVFAGTGASWVFHGSTGVHSVDVQPRLVADDNVTILDSCRAGVGIGLLPEYIARDSLQTGDLRLLLQEYSVRDNWFKAYVPRRRMEIARVKELLAWLQLHFEHGSYSHSFKAEQHGRPKKARTQRQTRPASAS